jgi:hypothetical protein
VAVHCSRQSKEKFFRVSLLSTNNKNLIHTKGSSLKKGLLFF